MPGLNKIFIWVFSVGFGSFLLAEENEPRLAKLSQEISSKYQHEISTALSMYYSLNFKERFKKSFEVKTNVDLANPTEGDTLVSVLYIRVLLPYDENFPGVGAKTEEFLETLMKRKNFRLENEPRSNHQPLVLIRTSQIVDNAPLQQDVMHLFGKMAVIALCIIGLLLTKILWKNPRKLVQTPGQNDGTRDVVIGLDSEERFPIFTPTLSTERDPEIDTNEQPLTFISRAVEGASKKDISIHAEKYRKAAEQNPIQLNPKHGTWYLNALSEASRVQLEDAFENLPLDEAVTVLSALKSPMRRQVLDRMEIRPAIRQKIEDSIISP